MPPPPSNMEITNYDVLADEITTPISANESDIGLSLAAHSYHVGNNRLEVLCNIHNKAFSDFEASGDGTNGDSIVTKIMNIVQNQCVPNGRFLQRNKKGEWKEVEEEKRKQLIRQALSQITQQNQNSLMQGSSTAAGQSNQKAEAEADAEKKRRRRSSLLRRSVSSSMLPTMMKGNLDGKPFDDKKKAIRKALELSSADNSPASSRSNSPTPEREPQQTPAERQKRETSSLPGFGRSRTVEMGPVSRPQASRRQGIVNVERKPLVKETLKMDVLFNTAKTALLPGTDLHGNNRLRVMVTLQSAAYKDADDDGKEKMAEDLVGTIEKFWGGRLLAQVPTRRSRKGGTNAEEAYVQLEKIHSVQGIKNLLSGEGDSEDEASVDEETNMKQGRRASIKAIQTIASTTTATTGDTSASILPSTLPKLPDDMQHLRSAALKSLQKRKERQGLNSKIRGLTANKAAVFQDGGGSNASVISSGMSTSAGSIGAPIPTTVTSNLPQQNRDSHFHHYRQTSSGASVASTVTQMSSTTAGPGAMQRQSSLGGMSTASSNTAMSMNTVNAARTISSIHARQVHNMHPSGAQMPHNMMQPPAGLGFSEHEVPPNITTADPTQRYQQQPHPGMPSVPENFNNDFNNYGGPVQLNLNGPQNQFCDNSGGQATAYLDRNSLLNSTGSDGLPKFGQGEVELLMKGLEMAEQQEQQLYEQQQQQQNRYN